LCVPKALGKMPACEKAIHNLQFITGNKNKYLPFISSIILDLFYEGIHTGQHQKPGSLPLK
jgi:hypothetical protein